MFFFKLDKATAMSLLPFVILEQMWDSFSSVEWPLLNATWTPNHEIMAGYIVATQLYNCTYKYWEQQTPGTIMINTSSLILDLSNWKKADLLKFSRFSNSTCNFHLPFNIRHEAKTAGAIQYCFRETFSHPHVKNVSKVNMDSKYFKNICLEVG